MSEVDASESDPSRSICNNWNIEIVGIGRSSKYVYAMHVVFSMGSVMMMMDVSDFQSARPVNTC